MAVRVGQGCDSECRNSWHAPSGFSLLLLHVFFGFFFFNVAKNPTENSFAKAVPRCFATCPLPRGQRNLVNTQLPTGQHSQRIIYRAAASLQLVELKTLTATVEQTRLGQNTHAGTHARTHAHTCTHAYAHTNTHTRARARTHTHARTHAYAHTHTHTHTDTHARMHTHRHTHAHTHTSQHAH